MLYQLISTVTDILSWVGIASALLTVVIKFVLSVCNISNYFNSRFGEKSRASRMLAEATDEKNPHWTKELAMKDFIKTQSRFITKKTLSNSARAIYLSIGIFLAFAVCTACILNYPFTDPGLKQILILAIWTAYLFFLFVMELMVLIDVPCVQWIYYKVRALLFKLSCRNEIEIISIDGMFAKAMKRPYLVVDARKKNSTLLWDELPEVVEKDDVNEGSLKKEIIYFICSNYGKSSGEYAKELQGKGFEAYSVWCAFSQYKKFKRIIYELYFLKEEKLLTWQKGKSSIAREESKIE